MDKPLVSVCVPSLGREAKLQRLLDLIPLTAEWPHEIIVKYDDWPPNNRGCPTVLAECVAESKGEFCAFLGNDCVPQQGWLRIAMECMAKWFPEMDGITIFQDNYWKRGELPLHWVASKQLLPMLGGHYFFPGYNHCCCDSELWGRCVKANKYVHCPEAKVYHDHPIMNGMQEKDMDDVYRLAYDPVRRQQDCDLLLARAKQFGFRIRENFRAPQMPRNAFTLWLGDAPMPKLVEGCIESQREFTKGWGTRVIRTADIPRDIPYVEQALASGKIVKAADYMRLWWLFHHGGVYFDADMELLRPFPEEMLTDSLFAGLERNGWINTGVIGAEPGHPILKKCMEVMESNFRGDDDKVFEAGGETFTRTVYGMGVAEHGVRLYEPEVFAPYDHMAQTVNVTDNSVAYHHFMVSWGNREQPWERLWRDIPK